MDDDTDKTDEGSGSDEARRELRDVFGMNDEEIDDLLSIDFSAMADPGDPSDPSDAESGTTANSGYEDFDPDSIDLSTAPDFDVAELEFVDTADARTPADGELDADNKPDEDDADDNIPDGPFVWYATTTVDDPGGNCSRPYATWREAADDAAARIAGFRETGYYCWDVRVWRVPNNDRERLRFERGDDKQSLWFGDYASVEAFNDGFTVVDGRMSAMCVSEVSDSHGEPLDDEPLTGIVDRLASALPYGTLAPGRYQGYLDHHAVVMRNVHCELFATRLDDNGTGRDDDGPSREEWLVAVKTIKDYDYRIDYGLADTYELYAYGHVDAVWLVTLRDPNEVKAARKRAIKEHRGGMAPSTFHEIVAETAEARRVKGNAIPFNRLPRFALS